MALTGKFVCICICIYGVTIRGHSSSLLHGVIACNHLLFPKIFSNFVYFCPHFQIFCPFQHSLMFFSKIAHMLLLSTIGPDNKNLLDRLPQSYDQLLINKEKRAKNSAKVFFNCYFADPWQTIGHICIVTILTKKVSGSLVMRLDP